MGRIIAIDYGQKRTGIAVTDPLQIIAGALTTVATHNLLAFLSEYFAKETVERIVIGLPRQTNGQESQNAARVKAFAKKCQKQFPHIPISFEDERYTSVLAHKAILESGAKRKTRQDKALVDQVSATIILQSYLETNKHHP